MWRKLTGGFLVILGYLLSPLSWWNDLYKIIDQPVLLQNLHCCHCITATTKYSARSDILTDDIS